MKTTKGKKGKAPVVDKPVPAGDEVSKKQPGDETATLEFASLPDDPTHVDMRKLIEEEVATAGKSSKKQPGDTPSKKQTGDETITLEFHSLPDDPEHVDMKQIIEEEMATVAKKKGKDAGLDAISREIEELDRELSESDGSLVAPDLVTSMKAQGERPREAWKILFSGLDFAGKSSILATIKHEFQKIVNPMPTKLTERSTFSFLGQQVAEWDLGGQRLYRIQYLKRPMVYYADTSILFYVIDTMDEERYEEAIDFLYDSLQVFDKLNINPLIAIMFHKYDPDVEKDRKASRIELKITALTNKIKVITYGRDVLFFRTSIFNKFSVIEAFSQAMLELFPDKNLVDYVLAELAAKTNANIIILLDENRFILGQNIVETDDRQYEELVSLAQNTLLSFLYLDENFKFYPFLHSDYMVIQLERFSFLWARIIQDRHPFYIIVFKDGANFDDLLAMDLSSVGKTLIQLVNR